MSHSRPEFGVELSDRQAMELAIAEAMDGVAAGQSPFGCAILKGDRLVASAHNRVWQTTDPSAHAEVTAIREACRRLGTIDLSGCVLFTTCEPCPMCYSASHWARVSKIVFGARIADAQAAGFNELVIAAARMRDFSGDGVELVADFMGDECRAVFQRWLDHGRGKPY